jgi:hypothetical protein
VPNREDAGLDAPTGGAKSPPPPANIVEAFLRAREMRELKSWREDSNPILWALLGLLLMACFFLALTTHWFPK